MECGVPAEVHVATEHADVGSLERAISTARRRVELMAMAVPAVRRVATYERVSSEDQRERETVKTQTDEIARSLALQPGIALVERYVDDGVSGTIPMAERPAGGRLLRDAAAGQFSELWVYKVDRLGRVAGHPGPSPRPS